MQWEFQLAEDFQCRAFPSVAGGGGTGGATRGGTGGSSGQPRQMTLSEHD